MTPYYEHGGISIYHGDCRDVLPIITADVLLSDPPYGIAYKSEHAGVLPRFIQGDESIELRDTVLDWWGQRPALIFGSWRAVRPADTRMVLIWDTGGALGMGALDLPWKPSHQEIYVLGRGFSGQRTSDVISVPPVQSMASNGRVHPHEKPVDLLLTLLWKCPLGAVLDPFVGCGSTLLAAKRIGRSAIGIEIEERYCEIAAKRLAQDVLPLEMPPVQAEQLSVFVP